MLTFLNICIELEYKLVLYPEMHVLCEIQSQLVRFI